MNAKQFQDYHQWTSTPEIVEAHLSVPLSPNSITAKWKSAKNSGFNFSTQLRHCRFDLDTLTTRMKLYPLVGEQQEMIEAIKNEAHWVDCTDIEVDRQNVKTLSSLTPRTTYRLQVC